MVQQILLARHGQTDWNLVKRFQGQMDIPLNENGRAQAALLARQLEGEGLAGIYSSDLSRTYETAEIVAARHPDAWLAPEPRLRQVSFGVFEGRTHAEITSLYPEAFAAWRKNRAATPPEGETMPHIIARVRGLLADLSEMEGEGAVLLVSHGALLRVLLCEALGLPAERQNQFKIRNAALSELRLKAGRGILVRLNDAACG